MEREPFPETLILVEADRGTALLSYEGVIKVTTAAGTQAERVPVPAYSWADPAYAAVHASIVDCNSNLLAALRNEGKAETTAADNIETLRLVDAAYRSAASGDVCKLAGA